MAIVLDTEFQRLSSDEPAKVVRYCCTFKRFTQRSFVVGGIKLISVDHLPNGLVGTIVHVFHQNDNDYYLIEFTDAQGHEYATATLAAHEFLVLHQEIQLSRS